MIDPRDAPRKIIDVSRLHASGWCARPENIAATYRHVVGSDRR